MYNAIRIRQLCTYPNAITLMRPAVTGPFLWCCAHAQADIAYGVAALLLFGLIAASDALDGWMARRRQQESALGRVLDHICDVSFILLALGFFAQRGWAPWWLPLAIAWAFGLYALRSWWLTTGTMVPTLVGSWLGHLGGIFNYVAVGLVVLDLCTGRIPWTARILHLVFIPLASLALISGLEHLYAMWATLRRANP